ncbi:MAG: NAD(P)/FAD-dependent oxidoreductase [Actinobacteria bacterium]|nr:NAD(P)/FAD-dependent oxidoreductase [Actinomycetota bacterium]
MEREFDVVVVGAGPAGEVAAGRLADAGLEVALVEPHLVGGECSYYACMPSKALLRPAELAAEVARVPGLAITTLDPAAVLRRRDEVIHDLDDASQLPWLEARGVTLFRGFGRLDGERRVRVGDDLLTVRKAVVVATGSGAAMPPIPGLAESRPWTNREATTASLVPASLAILGGGVVGVELAQAWASLGSSVTVVEGMPRLIAREEEFASQQVEEALRAGGVDVRTGAKAVSVARDGEAGEVTVALEDGTEASGAELLVAVGRRPLTQDIGLETIGLEPGASIEVGGDLRCGAYEWLYAIGDVNGRSLLTHMGKYQARLAADAILGKQVELRSDGALSPRVIFTEPQVAAVGYTLAGAKEAGLDVRAVDVGTNENAGGSFVGRNAPGTSRLVVDEKRRVIVGATFTGPTVADSLHAATIAVVAEVPLETLWHCVPAFPTRSELWLRLLETYGL